MSVSRQVHLCSAALLAIGADPIASFEQGTVESELASIHYPLILNGLLSLYPWSFALKQRRLAPTTVTPTADFEYRFELPGECVRVISIGSEETGRGQIIRRGAERKFDCDVDSVVLTYVVLPDESRFEPYFDLALITRLEAKFALPITGDRLTAAELDKIARLQFQESKTADAQQTSPPAIESFPLVEVR